MSRIPTTAVYPAEAPGALSAHVQLRQVTHACALDVETRSTHDILRVG